MSSELIIDEYICDCYSDEREDEEGANPIVGWCHDNRCKCEDIPFDECLVKAIQYCKLKDEQLKFKEEECDGLKKIINEAQNSGLDLKSFLVCEAVQNEYEQQLDKLKAEKEELKKELFRLNSTIDFVKVTEHSAISKYNRFKQALIDIKELAGKMNEECFYGDFKCEECDFKNGCAYLTKKQILQKIGEVLDVR